MRPLQRRGGADAQEPAAAGRDGARVRRLRVRRHARLRGRRAGRRRGRARRAGHRAGAGRRGGRAGRRARASGRPSQLRAGRAGHRRPGRRAAVARDDPQGGIAARRRGRRPCAGRRRRAAAAAARADRVAGRGAPRLRHRRPPAHPVAQLRADGFRVGPRRRDPRGGHGRPGAVHAPAGGARQAGDRLGLPCPRQGALALRGDRVQGCAGDGSVGAARRRRIRLHAHVEHPPRPDPAHPEGDGAQRGRDRPGRPHPAGGRAGRLGTHQLRRQAARSRQLPLPLAGAGACARHRARGCPCRRRPGSPGIEFDDPRGEPDVSPSRAGRRGRAADRPGFAGGRADRQARAGQVRGGGQVRRQVHRQVGAAKAKGLAPSAQKAVEEVTPIDDDPSHPGQRSGPRGRQAGLRRRDAVRTRRVGAGARRPPCRPVRGQHQGPSLPDAPGAQPHRRHPAGRPEARRDVAAAGQQVDADEPEAGPAPGRRVPEPGAGHLRRGTQAQPAPEHPGAAAEPLAGQRAAACTAATKLRCPAAPGFTRGERRQRRLRPTPLPRPRCRRRLRRPRLSNK